MTTYDSLPRFPRIRNGYDPSIVDEFVHESGLVQRAMQQELDSLRTQLTETTAELQSTSTQVARLRQETAALTDTSPAPQAMTDRIAKMLRVAVDEVSEMQYESRLEAESMLATAQTEADGIQAKARQLLAEIEARQRAMESEYAEVMNKAREEAARITAQAVSESERMREVENLRREQAESELTSELAKLRRETELRVEELTRSTNQECELRLLNAKQEAERRLRVANEQIDRRLQDARRALDESNRKRVTVLEQLMQVHGTLESIPAILENAYQDLNITPESGLALTSAAGYETVTYEAVTYEESDGDSTLVEVAADGEEVQYAEESEN